MRSFVTRSILGLAQRFPRSVARIDEAFFFSSYIRRGLRGFGSFAQQLTPTEILASLRNCCSAIDNRGVIRVTGPQASTFLQGLITADMRRFDRSDDSSKQEPALHAALLNAQGRLVFSTFISRNSTANEEPVSFLLDCDSSQLRPLMMHLKLYRLRTKVEITDVSEQFSVWSVFSGESSNLLDRALEANASRGLVFHDPRSQQMGLRMILPSGTEPILPAEFTRGGPDSYHYLRMLLGLPETNEEVPSGQAIAMEANFDLMHSIAYNKGCYLGQELVSRVHHLGVVRKRVLPVVFVANRGDQSKFHRSIFHEIVHKETAGRGVFDPQLAEKVPPVGTELVNASTSVPVGKLVASMGNVGLVMTRLETLRSDKGNTDGPVQLSQVQLQTTASGLTPVFVRPSWWNDQVVPPAEQQQ